MFFFKCILYCYYDIFCDYIFLCAGYSECSQPNQFFFISIIGAFHIFFLLSYSSALTFVLQQIGRAREVSKA